MASSEYAALRRTVEVMLAEAHDAMEERLAQMLRDAAERDGAMHDHHANIGEELAAINQALLVETSSWESNVCELRDGLAARRWRARQPERS